MRNRSVKTRIKHFEKGVRALASDASPDQTSGEEAGRSLIQAQSLIAKAAKKGVIHKNTAARKIARLTKVVNALST